MTIQKVGVAGCGIMGSGIAQVAALSGYDVIVREVNKTLLDTGLDKLKISLSKAVDKEKIAQQDMEDALGRIHDTLNLEEFSDCDLVIEAIVEDLDAKKELFASLEDICSGSTIFASNTSSLTISKIAESSDKTGRFVGLHFFNPVIQMPLVEVVKSSETDEDVFDTAYEFAEDLGKKPIACKDETGFVVNRLLVPFLLDAIRSLESGIASITDIDKGMHLGAGHPMGPFTLLDYVGLDTTHHIANIMYEEFGEERFAPPKLLTKLVENEMYGKKSGRGFYEYTGEKPVPVEL
ncbi:MAG: 3-hydroxybutyryl-CoA dehydrogenase [Candidatus Marinimicrobia bacterium]|nr:3-hydroxybutyryl-CoA dehydrogenase [Candidatus Neomarinimicrobiota bacterium]